MLHALLLVRDSLPTCDTSFSHLYIWAGYYSAVNGMCSWFSEGHFRLQSVAALQIIEVCRVLGGALPCLVIVTWIESEAQNTTRVSTEIDEASAIIGSTR